jgi:cytochrome c5
MFRLVVLAVAVALGACGMSPPKATPADAQRANVQLAELQDGRTLMVRKCGGCHAPPLPGEHAAGEWPGKLDEMADRSKLDPKQRYLIQQYFVVMASR